jgi:hypothetical protein
LSFQFFTEIKQLLDLTFQIIFWGFGILHDSIHGLNGAVLHDLDFIVLLAVLFNEVLDDGLIGLVLEFDKVLASNLDEVEAAPFKSLVLLVLLLVELGLALELHHEAFVVAQWWS